MIASPSVSADSTRIQGTSCELPEIGLLRNNGSSAREVLVLYLERPAQKREVALAHTGRFGYSDLKEAAPMEGYVF